jgi:hypothetical protein
MALAIKQRSPMLTPKEWFEGYQISVTDIRQIIDWANTRPEIDKFRCHRFNKRKT